MMLNVVKDMDSKQNSHTLMMGCNTVQPVWKTVKFFSSSSWAYILLWSNNFTPRNLPKKNENIFPRKTLWEMFIVDLFILVLNRKNPNAYNERIKNFDIFIYWNNIKQQKWKALHSYNNMNLSDNILRKWGQKENNVHCTISYVWISRRRNTNLLEQGIYKEEGTFYNDKTFFLCLHSSVNYTDAGIYQNSLTCTLKIYIFYCTQIWQ